MFLILCYFKIGLPISLFVFCFSLIPISSATRPVLLLTTHRQSKDELFAADWVGQNVVDAIHYPGTQLLTYYRNLGICLISGKLMHFV